jgi:hypothetical protein
MKNDTLFLRYIAQKIRFAIFLAVSFSFLACQNSPTVPAPVIPYSSPGSDVGGLRESLDTVLDKSKEAILPEKPDSATELPRINIASEPANLLNVTGFNVPKTAIFEMRLLNSGKTHSITDYSWQVIKLGIPFISEDQTLHTSTGVRLSYTFRAQGRFRVVGTVRTANAEVSSSSIIVVGLE